MSRQQAFCAILSAISLRISTTRLQTVERNPKLEVIKLDWICTPGRSRIAVNWTVNALACAAVESMLLNKGEEW
jgi:hypothetical protein